jgi:hypothetical protein
MLTAENGGLWSTTFKHFRSMNSVKGTSLVILKWLQARYHREVLERLFSAPHPDAAKEYHDAYTKLLNDKVEAVLTGAAVMLLISPSYGAEVAVMGASVDRLKIRSPNFPAIPPPRNGPQTHHLSPTHNAAAIAPRRQ